MEAFLAYAPLVSLVLNFLIVPLIGMLWHLNTSIQKLKDTIHELEVTLHADFVTHDQLTEKLADRLGSWIGNGKGRH